MIQAATHMKYPSIFVADKIKCRFQSHAITLEESYYLRKSYFLKNLNLGTTSGIQLVHFCEGPSPLNYILDIFCRVHSLNYNHQYLRISRKIGTHPRTGWRVIVETGSCLHITSGVANLNPQSFCGKLFIYLLK